MTASEIALLVGLLVAPAVLLWLGHGLRHQGRIGRRAFWGGVIGHTVGTSVLLVVVLLPPVYWAESAARTITVYWVLLITTVAGAALGGLTGRPSGD